MLKLRILSVQTMLGGILFTLSSTMGVPALSQETTNKQIDKKPELPEVRKELQSRVERDQIARRKMVDEQSKSAAKGEPMKLDSEVIKTLRKIDNENRTWLKAQVEKHGWLGKTKVGKDGAHLAWLLVQHADADLQFQKRCLELMAKAGIEQVSPQDLAYLTDRILSAENKPQIYGTQIGLVDGEFKPVNVEDPENLDKRRKAIGLSTMDEYLEQIKKAYKLGSKK